MSPNERKSLIDQGLGHKAGLEIGDKILIEETERPWCSEPWEGIITDITQFWFKVKPVKLDHKWVVAPVAGYSLIITNRDYVTLIEPCNI